jgi:hypothetical protein
MKGIQFEYVGKKSDITQAVTVSSERATKGAASGSQFIEVGTNVKQRTKTASHVKSLVKHLIRWCQDHEASITTSVKGLCEGTLTKRTASSLRAILAAYQPETFLVASELLTEVEHQYGPVSDVLITAEAELTYRGYVLNPVFTKGIGNSFVAGGAV